MAGSLPVAPGRIFMSYRRDEADYPASWLYDRLVARFGRDQVFKDVDSIDLGDNFAEAISNAVGTCDALLALIGKHWLTVTDEAGNRRLDNPDDFVRLEIEAALKRKVRVIPILLGNATMPREEQMPASLANLAWRQAMQLSPNRFEVDTERLMPVLDKTLAEAQAKREAQAKAEREAAERAEREAQAKAEREAAERAEAQAKAERGAAETGAEQADVRKPHRSLWELILRPTPGRRRFRKGFWAISVTVIVVAAAVAANLLDIRSPSGDTHQSSTSTQPLQLPSLNGLTIDAAGNLFVTADHQVRKVATNGTVMIVAGTGEQGFSGDGGTAAKAELNNPSGLAIDVSGNLYIADNGNNRIRKITTDGRIFTLAGTGQGLALKPSGDGGPAIRARLVDPVGVAIDARGNLYIADNGISNNGSIRKVSPNGRITTVNGQVNTPDGLAIDAIGNLYVADSDQVRKIATNGRVTTVAGTGETGFSGDGGPATEARLNTPSGLAVDAAGNLYIADRGNNRVRRVTTGGRISTVAGRGETGFSGDGGQATQARLFDPIGVAAVDVGGNFYIADRGTNDNGLVRKVAPDGRITTVSE
jgi:sugar lactone lactonase YvrE